MTTKKKQGRKKRRSTCSTCKQQRRHTRGRLLDLVRLDELLVLQRLRDGVCENEYEWTDVFVQSRAFVTFATASMAAASYTRMRSVDFGPLAACEACGDAAL